MLAEGESAQERRKPHVDEHDFFTLSKSVPGHGRDREEFKQTISEVPTEV